MNPVVNPVVIDGVTLDVQEFPVPGAPALLVLPGGGFREHTPHDGEGYAHRLNSLGLGAVVLRYRLRPDPFPLALQQARTALAALLAGDLLAGADCARTGVIGSSAGGLLAGLLATGAVLSVEPPPATVPRPAFHVQSYGLADLALLPDAAVAALLGDRSGLAAELSPVHHVTAGTAPTFVWATAQDRPGLPNALAWARVLAEHDVPVELHVYPEGGHGVGLADGVAHGAFGQRAIPHTAQWTEAFRRWLVLTVGPW
ncbi:alpha/beta hydrolase [Kineococcus sp. SYSU DK001]|uniref:alpha/beta hydrolase n=1 Tax=Kineococcus sp. SYSU DK001 TaxID=3383122 RepID=UPI003D7DDC5A